MNHQEKKKILCGQCDKIAVWYYVPANSNHYRCDEHISRGCSCNVDPNTGEEDRDELGRLLPCCEYDYGENGFNEDGEDNYWLDNYEDWDVFDDE